MLRHCSSVPQIVSNVGRSVGVDEYVAKFVPQRLAEVLRRLIPQHAAAPGAA